MPLILPAGLPGFPPTEAMTPGLHIALINLMPVKPEAERDILSLLQPNAINIKVDLLTPLSHQSRNTPREHIDTFYSDISLALTTPYDAIILTGAPVEHLPFEEVDYWTELVAVIDHAMACHIPMLNICWGAFAALYHLHGIPMRYVKRKYSGIYPQTLHRPHPLTHSLPAMFNMPNSRHATWHTPDIEGNPTLNILASSPITGVSLISDGCNIYLCGHPEYATDTLDNEYHRDLGKGLDPDIPCNYYPDDDPARAPQNTWRAHALTLYRNWVSLVHRKKIFKTLA